MTKREFFEEISKGNLSNEAMTFATEELDRMDTANQKRRAANAEKNAEKAAANVPLYESLVAILNGDPKTMDEIMEAAGLKDVTAQRCALVFRTLGEGVVAKTTKRVGKTSRVAYCLASMIHED